MLQKIASNYLQNHVKKEYNNPQVRDALMSAGLSTLRASVPLSTGLLGYYLNKPDRDQQGNVTFPGYNNNIYDSTGNIIKYEPIKNTLQTKPNQPIGKPLSILQKYLGQYKRD